MKVAVIGAGAIGSLAAGYLAKAGEDIHLIGHPDQVDAIRKSGLTIKSPTGIETVPLKVSPRLDQRYDLVIFAVKTQDLEQAYQENSEFLEDGLVMTSQNGVQADNILSSHFEKEQIISSIVMFGSTYIKPGEITFNFPGDWIVGKPFGPNDSAVENVVQVLQKGFPVVVSANIMGMKWLKLFVNFNNCLPALIGKSMQETFADMDFCKLSVMLLKEGFSIVQDAGVKLESLPSFPVDRIEGLANMPVAQGAAIIHKTLTGLSQEPLYGSILQSIMRGRISEIDYINGEVVHLGRNIRKEALLNHKVVEMVHKVEQTGQFFDSKEIKKAFHLN